MTILSADKLTSLSAKHYLPLITNKGKLRSSKPKDPVAAYIWRYVAFYISGDRKMQCMPMTADFGITQDTIPETWNPEAPQDYIDEKCARTRQSESDIHFCLKHAPSIEEYHKMFWKKYDRRNSWIRLTLNPIIDEIVDSVPVRERHGVNRWKGIF